MAQHRVDTDGHTQYLDFAWPEIALGVECDSIAFHFGARSLATDDRRQNRLVLLGWTILRFTWDDLRHRPEVVTRQLRQALARAGWKD